MKNPESDLAPTTKRPFTTPPAELEQLLTTDVMAIRELPNDLDKIERYRSAIEVKLAFDFLTTRLSPPEQEAFKGGQDFSSFHGRWDSYILEVAQQYGARLLLSNKVMQRVWSWQCGEKDGARKLKQLFHEIHRSALIGLRRATGRISQRHKNARPKQPGIFTLDRKNPTINVCGMFFFLMRKPDITLDRVPGFTGRQMGARRGRA